jgi:hypothetical protein
MCEIRDFNFEAFQTLKKELKANHHSSKQTHKQKHEFHKHENLRPCLKLLLHLWPGDWRQHWRKLKAAFERQNVARVKSAGKRARKLKPPSQNEFWRFIGLIMAGGVNGQGGNCSWESREKQLHCGVREFSEPPDAGRCVSLTRFKIRKFFPKAFSDASHSDPAEGDCNPWHPIIALVEDLNINRHQTVCSSNIKTMDQFVSGWKPRKNKLGGLPNFSFICCKPAPLGTEFKDTADGKTSLMLFLEIQGAKLKCQLGIRRTAFMVLQLLAL